MWRSRVRRRERAAVCGSGKEIRRIRRKLGLSQAEAAHLTGGGHNAFSRYERGEVAPLPAVTNLLRLLDKHPKLLKDLASPSAAAAARTRPAASVKSRKKA
jgi:HTH-type transcriptional regulator/antitoxin MqsA